MKGTLIEEAPYITEYSESIEKIKKILLQYGLTGNQSKVYLHLTKSGEKTASEISKHLKIPRTETYHLLSSLEKKGIIFTIFGKPSRFNSISLEEATDIMIDDQKKIISELESKKETVLSLWETLPEFKKQTIDHTENKFQTLQGKNSILGKIEQMIKLSKNSINVLGSEANFIKFYHTDFIKFLKNTKSNLEILTTFSEKGNYVFEGVSLENIKRLEDNHMDNFSFIIKDGTEVLFFINNSDSEFMAMWTDSKSFVTTLESLFKMIWKKSMHIIDQEDDTVIQQGYEHRLREIEQEKVILNYLQKNILEKMEKKN